MPDAKTRVDGFGAKLYPVLLFRRAGLEVRVAVRAIQSVSLMVEIHAKRSMCFRYTSRPLPRAQSKRRTHLRRRSHQPVSAHRAGYAVALYATLAPFSSLSA